MEDHERAAAIRSILKNHLFRVRASLILLSYVIS